MQVFMQLVVKSRKQCSLSTNSQPNAKIPGYVHEGSVYVILAGIIRCQCIIQNSNIILFLSSLMVATNFPLRIGKSP